MIIKGGFGLLFLCQKFKNRNGKEAICFGAIATESKMNSDSEMEI